MKNLIAAGALALAVLAAPAPAGAAPSQSPECDAVIINDALLIQNRILRSQATADALTIQSLRTNNDDLYADNVKRGKALDRKDATIARLRAKIHRLQGR